MVVLFTETANLARRVGVYRIATVLRRMGVEVEVIDYLSSWDLDTLLGILDRFTNIEWVGFSTTYTHLMPIYSLEKVPVAKITDLGREDEVRLIEYFRNRNVPLVLGGSNADQVKNYRKNFYVIIGYADVAVQALHNHITQNTDLIYTVINDNKVVYADTNYKDIDLNIVETEFVESDFVIDNEIIPIEISRGCIFKCKFCNYGHIGKKPGTYIRSKESIKSDIQRAYAQYGIKDYLFVDDTFNDSIEKMQMIKEIREELNIPFNFWAYGRLDLLAAHPEMIELMGEIGWTAVTFGVETLNKQSGASVGKGANPERLKNTLLLLKEKYPKLHVQVNLIIGLPHSTKEDIKNTIDWFIDTKAATFISVKPLIIPDISKITSSSEISRNPEKFGYTIRKTDTFNYSWKNDTWTLEEARTFGKEMQEYITTAYKAAGLRHRAFQTLHSIKRRWKDARKISNKKFTLREFVLEHKESHKDGTIYIEKKTEYLENLIKTKNTINIDHNTGP